MITHTREKLIKDVERAANAIHLFYQQDFVNYSGTTSDTIELYTEVIAEWALDNIHQFQEIPVITRISSYRTAGHHGVIKNPDSNRTEELLAKRMFTKSQQSPLPLIGTILDYQTPLKNKQTDKAGKIDLLSYDGETLRLLELKEPGSLETMLRCILEGLTYLKTMDRSKLLNDFELPSDTRIEVSPFVAWGSAQHKEMAQDRPAMKKLMAATGAVPLYYKEEDQTFMVLQD